MCVIDSPQNKNRYKFGRAGIMLENTIQLNDVCWRKFPSYFGMTSVHYMKTCGFFYITDRYNYSTAFTNLCYIRLFLSHIKFYVVHVHVTISRGKISVANDHCITCNPYPPLQYTKYNNLRCILYWTTCRVYSPLINLNLTWKINNILD